MRCYRCGMSGHLIRDCPRAYDVRYLDLNEIDATIEHLTAQKDVLETQARTAEEQQDTETVVESQPEDFLTGNE
jgi:hypothetical protein